MYPSFIYGDTVTILHRYVSGQDEFNNDVYDYKSEDVGNCSVQQSTSREAIAFTEQVITGIVVFVPFGTDIGYLDAIIVDGVQYEVNANPEKWTSPFSGRSAPIRVQGILVEGAAP